MCISAPRNPVRSAEQVSEGATIHSFLCVDREHITYCSKDCFSLQKETQKRNIFSSSKNMYLLQKFRKTGKNKKIK